MSRLPVFLVLALYFHPPGESAFGQPKTPSPKDQPKITLANPVGLVPGTTRKVMLRGLKLDTATEIRFPDGKLTGRIIGKGTKTDVPAKMDANRIGDTQIEAEITVPADFAGATASIVVVTAAGESTPHPLLIDKTPTVGEIKPSNAFRKAQAIQVPQIVDGVIDRPLVVRVFRLEGKAGQKVVIEVQAARHGSALDSMLMLHNEAGQLLAVNDDAGGSTDSRIEVTLPRAGRYFVSVMDANDLGSAAHVYRLSVQPGK